MKRNAHRLLRRTLASAAAAAAVCGLLTALPDTGLDARPVAASDATTTVFYSTKTKNWAAYNLHYAPDGGSWTTVPGVAMEAACTDWVKKTVPLAGAEGIQATFNNGSGVWDNNGGANYDLGSGNITVKDGVVAHSDPCADSGDPDPSPTPSDEAHTASVYYSTATVGWTTTNLHYQPAGGSWTTVPGVGMEPACTGWVKKTVDLGTATSMKAAFNNGNGVWDNNNGGDYTIPAGLSTVKDRAVAQDAQDPCAAEPADTEAPTVPSAVTAKADGVAVVLSWEPSTDNTKVTKYQVTRTGGTKGSVVTDVTSTVLSESGLEEHTAYTYTVKAIDAAGNTSAPSAPAKATTGDKPPAAAQGTPLGTDPRKDPIYFVLTARFNDGDASNNRGGSQDVKSGNAANNDPMFRGTSRAWSTSWTTSRGSASRPSGSPRSS